MADKIKVYYPATLTDTPIAFDDGLPANTDYTNDNKDIEGIDTVEVGQIYRTIYATEVVSVSFDTSKSRILGTFTFAESGAIQIGKYVNGESGQIQLTPNGIVATNSSGDTTFALDGTTGDATFSGTLTSGSIITGAIDVGDNSVIIDGINKRIVINDGTTNRIVIGEV